jgi:glycosyltransferase involved in cell wall biosynthesis
MNLSDRPILSLIIPTRERAETLSYTLASALAQSRRDYEVVVSDNASTDGTRAVVERAADARVRYLNTGTRRSMCDNYEFALQHALGGHVLFIGDDDAVIPGALDGLLETIAAAPNPLIYTWPLHTYDWPGVGDHARVAYLAAERPSSEVNLKAKAKFVVGMGGWKYYELPSPYHSAIPRQILDRLRERTGRVFHSTQPDVFTAMAIPAYADVAINLGHSVTLHGRSARSNALGFVSRSGRANIDRFIREYGAYQFHSALYSGVSAPANMIPDAILRACDLFPSLYAGTPFNFEAMWAYVCRLRFASHLEVLRHIVPIRRHHRFRIPRFLLYSALQELSVWRRRWLNLWMPLGKFRSHTPDNILEFARALAGRAGATRFQ